MIYDDPIFRKTKRNRQKTVCKDLRRSWFHCGMCGSPNLATQGVEYCTKCGKEEEYLALTFVFHLNMSVCDCSKYSTRYLEVHKCMDCGAVQSNYCPNCNYRKCWKSTKGDLYCHHCGFKKS